MAKTTRKKRPTKGKRKAARKRAPFRPLRRAIRWILRVVLAAVAMVLLLILGFSVINPPTTYYMWSEGRRLGGVDQEWVPIEAVAPVMPRSAVAAEDANFCSHWGFDVDAIRAALEEGSGRGASTITQQVVKNVFLWHGRTWTRKVLEAALTPVVEAVWSKRRILEVYLNVAEFDEGVFGIEAAARHYFNTGPEDLSALQAARLAAVLPAPQVWSASRPSQRVRSRTARIIDGAATIRADGRATCFED